MIVNVAVNFPVYGKDLSYLTDLDLQEGDIIEVPLGRRAVLGCVVGQVEKSDQELKSVLRRCDEYPRLDPEQLKLYRWMSGYYHYPLGQLIIDVLPHSKKRPRPLKKNQGKGESFPFELNEEQAHTVECLQAKLGHFHKALVLGVTGSGKSIVFLKLIQDVLSKGQSVLYLLPEINLTPQFLRIFGEHLGSPIFTYHSEVTGSEKFLIWHEAAAPEKAALFIGVRSSIFLPIHNLGLIIIDEEHDHSFKQDDRCPYNARDVAMKKAQLARCPVILGSATPSLETWHHFTEIKTPEVELFQLKKRFGGAKLPAISLIDEKMKSVSQWENSTWPLTAETLKLIHEALAKKEQVLVYLNRLGYSLYLQCRACGHQFFCPNCSVPLKFFKLKNRLNCQYCSYHERKPDHCPKCQCLTLTQKGYGTEKVLEILREQFPKKTIERFDRDEIKNLKELEDRLQRFHAGEIDLLVGTQMLAKGHNFERVNRVIILGMDQQLNYPDFRSPERVFQSLMQVSGRAGRYSQEGQVVIQTLNPERAIFEYVLKDPAVFYSDELNLRRMTENPPFQRLICLYWSSPDQDRLTQHLTQEVLPFFQDLKQKHFPEVTALGPRPTFIEKRKNQFSWCFLLKSDKVNQLHNFLNSFMINYKVPYKISLKIDVDPQTLL